MRFVSFFLSSLFLYIKDMRAVRYQMPLMWLTALLEERLVGRVMVPGATATPAVREVEICAGADDEGCATLVVVRPRCFKTPLGLPQAET
jgi:hypothetical protein